MRYTVKATHKQEGYTCVIMTDDGNWMLKQDDAQMLFDKVKENTNLWIDPFIIERPDAIEKETA